ncbi:MAG: hypothetical protein ACE5NM_09185 [Sedimentisphaerales bacterium]
MKVIQIPDELYERLKNCVTDPFDDTPESVISRLIDITDKAKSNWSPLDAHVQDTVASDSQDGQPKKAEHWRKQAEPVL